MELIGVVGGESQDSHCEPSAGDRRNAHKDNSRGILSCIEHEPAEVLVFGQQDAILDCREFDKFLIHGTLLKLGNGEDIVPGVPQRAYDCEIAVFIRQETHALLSGKAVDCFMRDRIGGVRQARADVVAGEPRISVE